MRARGVLGALRPTPRAGEERSARQAQFRQDIRKKPILLETVPAAPTHDELVEHALAVDPNLAAKADVDILERNGHPMGVLQALQTHRVGRRCFSEPDTFEIRRKPACLRSAQWPACGPRSSPDAASCSSICASRRSRPSWV